MNSACSVTFELWQSSLSSRVVFFSSPTRPPDRNETAVIIPLCPTVRDMQRQIMEGRACSANELQTVYLPTP